MAKMRIGIGLFFALLAFHGLFGQGTVRNCVEQTYLSQVGVRELTGRNDGREVEMYLAQTGFGPGAPWCAAFVAWTFAQCGVDNPNSAWSPSYFSARTTIYRSGEYLKGLIPQKGDVFGIWFNNLGRVAHVGFIHSWGESWVTTVEGNTNDHGSREGDGVYLKRRLQRQVYGVSSFLRDEGL